MTGLFRTLRKTVLDLEHAWRDGGLRTRLDDPGIAEIVGPDLFATYLELSTRSRENDPERRTATVHALLGQLSDEVFSVERWGTMQGQVTRTAKTLVTALADGPAIQQRVDQVAARRFWGLGFVHEDDIAATDSLARRCVRRGVKRFARDVRDLGHMLRRSPDSPPIKIPSHADRRFEQLMLDILDEDQPCARSARLIEDFCQKTDLRVSYPHLDRHRGARVQIKSTANPSLHEARIATIRRRETIVILSPVTLAEFVDEQQRTRDARVLDPAALRAFWRCFPAQPTAIDELAYAIRAELFRALQTHRDDPRGPMAAVPAPIRATIRTFVEDRAFRTTRALRIWETSHGPEHRRTPRRASGGSELQSG